MAHSENSSPPRGWWQTPGGHTGGLRRRGAPSLQSHRPKTFLASSYSSQLCIGAGEPPGRLTSLLTWLLCGQADVDEGTCRPVGKRLCPDVVVKGKGGER